MYTKFAFALLLTFTVMVSAEDQKTELAPTPPIDSKSTESKPMDSKPVESPFVVKTKMSGDLRYRFQSEIEGDDEERLTNRLRVRLGLLADIAPDTSLVFKLTS